MEQLPNDLNQTHHAHMGPLLGIIIVALALVFIGLYLWGGMIATEPITPPPPVVNNEPETPRAVADQEIYQTVSPSDELDAIEADITSTNFDALDTDVNALEAEYNTIPEAQ